MLNEELRDAVSELVIAARDGMSEAVLEYTTSPEADDAGIEALENCQGNVDTIAMAAEMGELEGLHALCGELSGHLAGMTENGEEFSDGYGNQLINWVDGVLEYMDHGAVDGAAEKLVAPLPVAQHDEWILMLGGSPAGVGAEDIPDIQSDEESVEFDASEILQEAASEVEIETPVFLDEAESEAPAAETMPEADFFSAQDTTHEFEEALAHSDVPMSESADEASLEGETLSEDSLASNEAEFNLTPEPIVGDVEEAEAPIESLAEELSRAQSVFSDSINVIAQTGRSDEQSAEAVEQYSASLHRLIEASAAEGNLGLMDFWLFLEENVSAAGERATIDVEPAKQALEDWPFLVFAWLRTPENPKRAHALVKHTQNAAWPHPLDSDRANDLQIALSGVGMEVAPEAEASQSFATASAIMDEPVEREEFSGSAPETDSIVAAMDQIDAASRSESAALVWNLGDYASEELDEDSMMGMLRGELVEAFGDLEEPTRILVSADSDTEALSDAAGDYEATIARVSGASEALGLPGLSQLFERISQNASALSSSEPATRVTASGVLASWPGQVLSYVGNPTDEHRCVSLIQTIQHESWPQPMDDKQARELLESLAQEPDEPEFMTDVQERQSVATEEDVALDVAADANQELVDAFLLESPQHAADFSARMRDVSAGIDVQENVGAAQRLTHTIKGSANLVAVKGVANLAHHLEDILEHLFNKGITPPPALANTLQESADCMEAQLDFLMGRDEAPDNAQEVLQDVLNWAHRIDTGQIDSTEAFASAVAAPVSVAFEAPARAAVAAIAKPAPVARTAAPQVAVPLKATEVLRVPTETVDEMFRTVGEMSIAIGQIQEHLKRLLGQGNELKGQETVLRQRRFELENIVDVRGMAARQRLALAAAEGDENFDPLELDQYDELQGATHAYIESVSDTTEMAVQLQKELSVLDALFSQQQRVNRGLQEVVMTTRMVAVNTIAARLQRSVRQACRATGKEAELLLVGGDTLVDGDVLNRLADPIMHMLRNAVDHGVEMPDDREAAGKTRAGEVTLSFTRDGGNLVVRCADDGKGLDYDGIRDTAIRRNILSESEMMDRNDMARLILRPGFSTRTSATQISGRGVGMDVVNTTIQSLKGNMDIGDGADAGTLITLRLPITLVTSHAVLVRAGKESFAVPTNSLDQILSSGTGEFSKLGNEITFQLGKEVYPARSLSELLGIARDPDADFDNSKTVLLLRVEGSLVAVTVDRVINSFDLVVKNLGSYVPGVRGVSGVSILGDGSVVAVLEVADLLRSGSSRQATVYTSDDEEDEVQIANLPKVLIVDDSLSVRQSLEQLMKDSGFQVMLARDGLDAVDALLRDKPDLVLTDLEMPRMNGLELASHIRASADTRELPVIMITSRTQQKHRDQAMQIGVSEYVTKPFSEEDLVASVQQLINS